MIPSAWREGRDRTMPISEPQPKSLLVERPNKTLRELALDKMREAIVDMSFAPGERLVERDLCAKLGVSRTVVREVLRHLESEGLVMTVGTRGPIITITTPEEATQIYEIRGVLEGIAARACAERGKRACADKLDAVLAMIEAGYAASDWHSVLAATTEFYRTLFDYAGKEIAWGIVNSLTARINHLRAMTIRTPGRDVEGPRQLRRIVDAIRAGDGMAAEAAARAHVSTASTIAAGVLAETPPLSI